MQTCAHAPLGSVILLGAPKANRARGGWRFAAAPDSHPLISSPPAFSLEMPLITNEPVARKPENKTWVLERLLRQAGGFSRRWGRGGGCFLEGLQRWCGPAHLCGDAVPLGILQALPRGKRSLLVAGASPGECSERSSNWGSRRMRGEDLPFQNICVRQ